MRPTKQDFFPADESPQLPQVAPKSPFVSAVQQFARIAAVPLASQFNEHTGHLLSLRPNESGAFLWTERMWTPDRGAHARRFLAVPAVYRMLDLRHAELSEPVVTKVVALNGFRASFDQVVTASDGRVLRVRNGAVDVLMDERGRVFRLTNTLRHGERHLDLDGILSEEQAIAAGKAALGWDHYDIERAELVASCYDRPSKGKCAIRQTIEPVYEVKLSAPTPRRSMLLLVHARSGAVLHQRSLTHAIKISRSARRRFRKSKAVTVEDALQEVFAHRSLARALAAGTTGGAAQNAAPKKVKAYSLLRVPDPNVSIVKQYYKVILESLPDPKVLANQNFRVFVGTRRTPVKAKPDGTFNYKPSDPEFSAVVAFFSLNIQWELNKNWGMKIPDGTPPSDVRVEDPDPAVQDNAQFDELTRELTFGKGTGVLTRHIAHDIGIVFHEGGHQVVYFLAPNNQLPGIEGAKCHEGLADMHTLLDDWWFQLKFDKTLGYTITVADITNSERKIGAYAAPPDGIRKQKNDAKPTKTRDPHDGCLPIGGAMSDVMVDFVSTKGIQSGLETFGKLMNAAVAGLPRRAIKFTDLLDSFLAADNRLNQGVNKQTIIAKFDDHHIRLPSSSGTGGSSGSPIIVVNP